MLPVSNMILDEFEDLGFKVNEGQYTLFIPERADETSHWMDDDKIYSCMENILVARKISGLHYLSSEKQLNSDTIIELGNILKRLEQQDIRYKWQSLSFEMVMFVPYKTNKFDKEGFIDTIKELKSKLPERKESQLIKSTWSGKTIIKIFGWDKNLTNYLKELKERDSKKLFGSTYINLNGQYLRYHTFGNELQLMHFSQSIIDKVCEIIEEADLFDNIKK